MTALARDLYVLLTGIATGVSAILLAGRNLQRQGRCAHLFCVSFAIYYFFYDRFVSWAPDGWGFNFIGLLTLEL